MLRSVLVATALVIGLVWSRGTEPLPAFEWAAVFLFLVALFDLDRLRIPNALTFPSLLLALGAGLTFGGLAGLAHALLGAATCFGILLVPFLLRGIGAGDVKAFMVLGALWGAEVGLAMILWTTLLAGAVSIGVLAVRGELGDLCARWSSTWVTSRSTGKLTYFAPAADSAAAARMPLGLLIGLGVVAYNLWGIPWA